MQIERKSQNDRPVPVVPGGVYRDSWNDYFVLSVDTDYDGDKWFRLVNLVNGEVEYESVFEDDTQDILNDAYDYVPDAKLVVPDSD